MFNPNMTLIKKHQFYSFCLLKSKSGSELSEGYCWNETCLTCFIRFLFFFLEVEHNNSQGNNEKSKGNRYTYK